MRTLLCPAVAVREAEGIHIDCGGCAVLLVRRNAVVFAWLDRCPHMGVSLRWPPRSFVPGGGRYLECINHMAVFRVEDGVCVAGPCVGERLTPLVIDVEDGDIWLCGQTVSEFSAGPRFDRC